MNSRIIITLLLFIVVSCKAQENMFKPPAHEIRAKAIKFEGDYAIFEFIKTQKLSYFFRVKNENFKQWEELYLLLLVNETKDGIINATVLHNQQSIRQARYDKEEAKRIYGKSYEIIEFSKD